MLVLSLHSCRQVAGGISPEELRQETADMKEWLAGQGLSPPLWRSFLNEFGPAAVRRELEREASPTAGLLSEDFILHYTDASAAVALHGDRFTAPIVCIGQVDQAEDEELVFGHAGAYYAYQAD
jgi:hypothetical protein